MGRTSRGGELAGLGGAAESLAGPVLFAGRRGYVAGESFGGGSAGIATGVGKAGSAWAFSGSTVAAMPGQKREVRLYAMAAIAPLIAPVIA